MSNPPRGCKWVPVGSYDGKSSLERHETHADNF